MENPMGVWNRLSASLDDDMMLVYPEMFIENQELFDDIVDSGYLVKDLDHPEGQLDWVTERQLYKLLSQGRSLAVISKLLVARLRLPWYQVKHEWLCSRQELEAHGDEYEVLEVYIWAKHKSWGKPHFIGFAERQHFDEHRDEYQITDIKYNVRWKFTNDDIQEILESPFVSEDDCVAHVYAEDIEFWDEHFNVKRKANDV